MARSKAYWQGLKQRLMPSWWAVAALAAGSAAAALALSLIPGATPVQQTLLAFFRQALWAVAMASAALAAAVYAWKRHEKRKANPYARLKLERELRFDMPQLGRRAAALAAGDPVIRIREMPRPERPEHWSVELLRRLEWKRFELLCAAYYGQREFRVEGSGYAADGGGEAKLYFRALAKPVALLVCRASGGRPVGVKAVRELSAAMAASGVAKGIFHCAGDYTNEAKAYAREHRIQLVTGAQLVEQIASLPEAVQRALLELTTAGDYTTPTCPSCGEKMVMCSSERGDFWGCSTHPKCRATLPPVQASW